MDRKNYKHGNYVDAEPNPHVDIKKYKTKDGKDDGKRYKVKDSEMKVSKKKRKGQGPLGALATPAKKVESKAKGGRMGYKGGKSVKKKGGCAIKGTSPILR